MFTHSYHMVYAYLFLQVYSIFTISISAHTCIVAVLTLKTDMAMVHNTPRTLPYKKYILFYLMLHNIVYKVQFSVEIDKSIRLSSLLILSPFVPTHIYYFSLI